MRILEAISWTEYLLTVGTLTGIYYGVVLGYHKYKYKKAQKEQSDFFDESEDDEVESKDFSDEWMEELEAKVNEIRGVLAEAGKEVTKEDILDRIRPLVANFGGLHRPAYRYALNNFIVINAQALCGVDIDEEELDDVWGSLSQ